MRIFSTRVGLIRVYEDVHISIGWECLRPRVDSFLFARVRTRIEQWSNPGYLMLKRELGVRLLRQIGVKNHLPHHEQTKVSWNVTKVLLPLLLHSWGNMFGELHLWSGQNQHITGSALSFCGSFPKQMVHAEMTSATISDYQLLPGCLWLSVVPWNGQDLVKHTLRLWHFTLFWSSQVQFKIHSRICMTRKSHCRVNCIYMCI